MTDEEMMDLMLRFRTAFRNADREGFLAAASDDFIWHQNFANGPEDQPAGTIIEGIDNMVAEIKRRKAGWADTSVTDLIERPAGDILVQTFTTKGVDENGKAFHWNVVDLYTVRDERICKKDTYWKHVK